MKSTILLSLILIACVTSKNLKQDYSVQKSVDPRTVKSEGEFSNIAPDATKVIKPKYANTKLQVVMNIEKLSDPVQRMDWHGSTQVPNSVTSLDIAGTSFGTEVNAKQMLNNESGVSNRTILTQTTENYRTNTIHPVLLNLNTNNPTVVPMPNKYTAPKHKFGTLN